MANLWVISFIIVFFAVTQASLISRNFTKRSEFDNQKLNDELIGEYNSLSLIECAAMCTNDCGFFGYHDELTKCRTHKTVTSKMFNETGWSMYFHDVLPIDCKDLRENGNFDSGVYEIYPYEVSSRPMSVYCDMKTMHGGWTAIQKRINGSLRFDRNWTEYKNGFGEPKQDVWIGNDAIHQLTKGKSSFLYVMLETTEGIILYELYDQFSISNETENYRLFLAGNATGTLGDNLLDTGRSHHDLSGMLFSTYDKDNDLNRASRGNCAARYGGGWWFHAFYAAFLNGPWSDKSTDTPWFPTVLSWTSVKKTMMLIRRH